MHTTLKKALDAIATHTTISPRLGIIVGSGQSSVVDQMTEVVTIPYQDVPGVDISAVEGQEGSLCLGYLAGVPTACFKGRPHAYEGHDASSFLMCVRLLKQLGCETVLMLNAAGSLRPEVGPGELVLITDHIHFQFHNPLLGVNDARFGPRFVGMDQTYDVQLREQMHHAAKACGLVLHEGVYISTLGPSFETPAEIRAFKTLGADVVGMSTIPEVLVARHCGLRVVLVSAITNLAAGLSDNPLTHALTLKGAELSVEKLTRLVSAWCAHWETVTHGD